MKCFVQTELDQFERNAADLQKLRAFAAAVLEDWPEGGNLGMFDIQDLAVKHGLLELKTPAPTEPCGESCFCAEYFTSDEFPCGITCYRKTSMLIGEEQGA